MLMYNNNIITACTCCCMHMSQTKMRFDDCGGNGWRHMIMTPGEERMHMLVAHAHAHATYPTRQVHTKPHVHARAMQVLLA